MIPIGDHWTKSITDLAADAALKTIKAANLQNPEMIVVGNMFSATGAKQEHLGPLVTSELGLEGIPAFKVETACASAAAALNVAYTYVKSGEVDCALAIGVEKMRDLEPSDTTQSLSMAERYEYTSSMGVSFVALNAMLARMYMDKYEVSRDELSYFPVLAHNNAQNTTHAQFRKPIEIANVSRSPEVSNPLTLLDCAPVGDGAAAMLLVNEKKIAEINDEAIEITASVGATSRFSIFERDDMLEFTATKEATKKALKESNTSIKDIDVIEVHDAFSIVAALSLEAMGFSRSGEACKDACNGIYDKNGKYPSVTFGGLKARGHPVGATGLYQAAEAYLQLSGKAGLNQIENANVAITQNVGAVDTSSYIHVLKGENN